MPTTLTKLSVGATQVNHHGQTIPETKTIQPGTKSEGDPVGILRKLGFKIRQALAPFLQLRRASKANQTGVSGQPNEIQSPTEQAGISSYLPQPSSSTEPLAAESVVSGPTSTISETISPAVETGQEHAPAEPAAAVVGVKQGLVKTRQGGNPEPSGQVPCPSILPVTTPLTKLSVGVTQLSPQSQTIPGTKTIQPGTKSEGDPVGGSTTDGSGSNPTQTIAAALIRPPVQGYGMEEARQLGLLSGPPRPTGEKESAVQAEMTRTLLSGHPVQGFTMDQGRALGLV